MAEHDLAVTSTTDGRSHRLPFLAVLQVRDGRAAVSREYLNVLGLAEATGRLPALAAEIDAAPAPAPTSWPGAVDPPPVPGPGNQSARAVFARFQHAVLANSADRMADVYALGGVLELPFTIPGRPAPRFAGRAEIRARLRELVGKGVRFEAYRNVRVHETTDPARIVVERDIASTLLATGQPHLMSYVYVIQVRDGRLAHVRDYVNPLSIAGASGGLTRMLQRAG